MVGISNFRDGGMRCLGLALVVFCLAGWMNRVCPEGGVVSAEGAVSPSASGDDPQDREIPGGLEGGVDWINVSGPIHLNELRGKLVLLDFWTYCCINCHHILPDLEYLEAKFPNELVVIGVHTAKFDAEKETENIRKKVAEYRIKHPVINDANQVLWNRFGVRSWPTLVLIDARGRYQGTAEGEGNRDALEKVIARLIAEHKSRGELSSTQIKFQPENEKRHDAPLLFPGKVTADAAGNRLFISDTGHNRIVVTDLNGRHIETIGTGETGLNNGPFDKAQFNRPQGTCLLGTRLYVADTENHAIREVDFEAKTVKTVAGTGMQSYRRKGSGKATESGLSSPWDVAPVGPQTLAIAMAGTHQIWHLDLKDGTVGVWAGTGQEDVQDGKIAVSTFAQPSGLAVDNQFLYVADSEGSAVRAINLERDHYREPSKKPFYVDTIAGTHDLPQGQSLFAFGDRDGKGFESLLQHCLGVAYAEGKLYVADSYNNKIKVIQLSTRDTETLAGSRNPGATDDPPQFDEPGGLSVAGNQLFVTDTNNHAIRVIDRATKNVKTLALPNVERPKPVRSKPSFPNATVIKLAETYIAPVARFELALDLKLPEGFEVNSEAPMPALIEATDAPELLAAEAAEGLRIDPPRTQFKVEVPLSRMPKAGETLKLKFSLSVYECKKTAGGVSGLCRVRNFVWQVPVRFESDGGHVVEISNLAPSQTDVKP
jgi:DNA-binding beta-propeller fold protein YncE